MKIHEYQAKEILAKFDVPVQKGILALNAEQAKQAFQKLESPLAVVKAQVHAGGRGKGGGVKLVKSAEEAYTVAEQILSKPLVTPQTGPEGLPVKKLLLCQGLDIDKEYYVGIIADRNLACPVLIACAEGGVEIEKLAQLSPEKIIREAIDVRTGLLAFQAKRVAYKMGFQGENVQECCQLLMALSKIYLAYDCNLLEINPLVKTIQGNLVALDAKMTFDSSAIFRHPDLQAMDDESELSEAEALAQKNHLSYVQLDGNIGCLVNGAGLAMGTMDIIKKSGGMPANFLDIGGGVKQDQVAEAFKIILSDSRVEAILVNIFGGIVQCDVVAKGILHAVQEVNIQVPLIVRLEGTNVEQGKALLENSNLSIITASNMKEAAQKAVAATKAQGEA